MLRFRESFRGYNRDDVNAYIEQLNLHFSKKEADLRALITDLEVKCNNPTPIIEIPESTKNELEALKAENERLVSELNALKEKINNDDAKATDEGEKSKLYDEMSAQVGNIIIVANSNADKIIKDAEEKAAGIVAEATIKAEIMINEAEAKKNEAVTFMEEKLKNASEQCLNEYSILVSQTKNQLMNVSDAFKNKTNELMLKLEEKSKEIENSLN